MLAGAVYVLVSRIQLSVSLYARAALLACYNQSIIPVSGRDKLSSVA